MDTDFSEFGRGESPGRLFFNQEQSQMEMQIYLEDLERRIDAEVEEDLLAQWRRFCAGQWTEEVFAPRRLRAVPKGIAWPSISTNRTVEDVDAMVLSQLAQCSELISSEKGLLPSVRSNYGVVILAVPFGCELFIRPDEVNAMPMCHPIGPEMTRDWLAKGMPSIHHPYIEKVYEAGRRFMEIKRQYPRIGKYLKVYHPDMQSPMDLLELIWGSEMYLAFGDEPEVVHAVLDRLTDFYIAVMREWQSIVPPDDPSVSCHWGYLIPGQIMLREDAAMNLPPAYFDEFIRPYDARLLKQLGGGCIHACGRVDHWTAHLSQMPGLLGFNMSQPHLNHMPQVLSDTVDKNILLIGFDQAAARQLMSDGHRLRGRVAII